MDVNRTEHEGPTFLALPKELRDKILDIVVRTESSVVVNGTASQLQRGHEVKIDCRRLASTCRQLYREATQIFYKQNAFELRSHLETPQISSRCSRLIRSLNIRVIVTFDTRRLHATIVIICIRGLAVTVKVEHIIWNVAIRKIEEIPSHAVAECEYADASRTNQ